MLKSQLPAREGQPVWMENASKRGRQCICRKPERVCDSSLYIDGV